MHIYSFRWSNSYWVRLYIKQYGINKHLLQTKDRIGKKYTKKPICDTNIKLKEHTKWISCVKTIIIDDINEKIVSGSYDNTIKIWDSKNGKCDATLIGHSKGVTCVANSSNNKIVSGSYDNTLKIWDVKTNICIMTLVGHVNCIDFVVILPCNQ